MVKWSEQDAAAFAIRRATNSGKPRSELQELKDAHAGKADNKARAPKVDGGVHPRFHISIDLLVSDERERDGDGAESTLLDCVIHARKRLLSLPDNVLLALYESLKRPGGCERED